MQHLTAGSPPRGASAPPNTLAPSDNTQLAGAVRYLDALDIFTRGDLERVRAMVPRWMSEYTSSSSSPQKDVKGDPLISSCTPLHLAVQCPRKDVIAAILDTGLVPVDAADAHGMTALHLAAKTSRKDVVKMLLRHSADDMLLDSQGQDALAYALDPEVAAVIQDHRSEVVRATTSRLVALVRNNDSAGVKALLGNVAESARINLAVREPDSGATLLHLAVQNNMLDLARWAITEGIDVFAVDKAGNLAEKYAGAEHHRMRELLSQAPMGSARTALSGRAPKFSGELSKWTNYAGGWKARWLELEDGVLSYYKNKADADSSCRGAINLRIAKIVMAKEKSQFEVLGKGSIKYRLRASDPQVAKQWVHLLNVSKQWALENYTKTSGNASAESESTHATDSQSRARTSSLLRTNASAETESTHATETRVRGASMSSVADNPVSPPGATMSRVSSMMSNPSDDDDDDDDNLYIARDAFFSTLAELRSQLFIQDRLLEGLGKSRHSSNPSSNQLLTSPEERSQYLSIAAQTGDQTRVLLDALDRAYRSSISGWQTRLRHEQERINMLADSLRAAVVKSSESTQQIASPVVPSLPAAATMPLEAIAAGGDIDEEEEDEDEDDFADATEEFFDTASLLTMTRAATAEYESADALPPADT
ncbi:hypothetical protein GGI21_003222, partial [Coemansia aciculifera]